MTYKRQQRIRELLEEVARLQREEALEQSMLNSGWLPLPKGGFRRPAPR